MDESSAAATPGEEVHGGIVELVVSRLQGLQEEEGMSTVEYAIGTIAAAAFAAILYTVVTGNSVVGAMTGLIERALSTPV
ncbi:DUF4244 domain-containing protein [Hoyosella altamirensis]|uniref:DUF4244 domain-containing protein n=1 Tax=Hoyosella altamirensis TaxID=616997 RepID=A0A839RN46_9ACTN|nr:DUF4244 domain-containing protein [Hoyosella altamirensis]MBB3037817.1 hypothetical protein [Hoyosella altamirensis]